MNVFFRLRLVSRRDLAGAFRGFALWRSKPNLSRPSTAPWWQCGSLWGWLVGLKKSQGSFDPTNKKVHEFSNRIHDLNIILRWIDHSFQWFHIFFDHPFFVERTVFEIVRTPPLDLGPCEFKFFWVNDDSWCLWWKGAAVFSMKKTRVFKRSEKLNKHSQKMTFVEVGCMWTFGGEWEHSRGLFSLLCMDSRHCFRRCFVVHGSSMLRTSRFVRCLAPG